MSIAREDVRAVVALAPRTKSRLSRLKADREAEARQNRIIFQPQHTLTLTDFGLPSLPG